jgi:iron complex outermembrane receptor protein
MKKFFLPFLITLLSVFPYRILAETEVWAGQVVSVSAKRKSVAEKTPGAVSVVVKEDINAKTIFSVDQAVNALPGVFNRRGKGLMDASSAVTLRGVPGQQRTLILFDGIQLNDAYTGSVSFGGIPVDDLERVEVARGPFSGLYGGNAMGGVINFIVHKPKKREFSIKTGYGNALGHSPSLNNMINGYFSYGDRFGKKLSLLFAYGYKYTSGYASDLNVQKKAPSSGLTGWKNTTDNTGLASYLIGDKGDNGWREKNISFRGWYDISDFDKLSFSFFRTEYDYFYDDPHTYIRDLSGAEVWSYSGVTESSFLAGDGGRLHDFFSASYSKETEDLEVKASLGYVDTLKNWYVTPTSGLATRFGGAGKISDTPSTSLNSELQLILPEFFTGQSFSIGMSYRFSKAMTSENNLSDWRNEEEKGLLSYSAGGKGEDMGVYLQDEITLSKDLIAYLSARMDWWWTYDGFAYQSGVSGYPIYYPRRSDSALSPKVSLVYNPYTKTTLRASLGRSFRSPTVYEMYRTWTSYNKVYQGNPNLKPETITSWDAGIELRPWLGFKLGAVYFENIMKDLIYRHSVNPNLLINENAGEAFGSGWEFEAEHVFTNGGRFFCNLTLNDAKITKNSANPASVGKKLADMPSTMYSFGSDFNVGSFYFAGLGRYVGKRYNSDANTDTVNGVYGSRDPYFTMDLKVTWKQSENLFISMAVQNVFDKVYFDYYRAPGRSWFTEVSWKI